VGAGVATVFAFLMGKFHSGNSAYFIFFFLQMWKPKEAAIEKA